MADQDRAPMIQLPIDQEIYMDSIQEGTVVEDATVATEIVSFERVGDAYVLEGAVVFAGYVSSGPTQNASEVALEDKEVEHIHHRLPFILRVPIQTQKRGILNVKSRLSGWKLSVASPGWLRVQGDLQVAGLSSEEGYHFECGGQQLGHPMFDMQLRSIEESESFPDDELNTHPKNTASDQATLRSEPDETVLFRSVRTPNAVEKSVEILSEARGGNGQDEVQEDGGQELGAKTEDSQIRAVDELEKFDRFFSERTHTSDDAVQNAALQNPVSQNLVQQNPVSQSPGTVAEFEFEHQLSPEEMIQFEGVPPSPKAMNETFVPSRSFLDGGFHAASGFAHSSLERYGEANKESVPFGIEEPESEEEARSDRTNQSNGLWSFVDFNAPEKKHMLRYIIVMEEETLETVAERLHCTKSELVRVNKMEVESISPGQTLLVPEVPFTFTK